MAAIGQVQLGQVRVVPDGSTVGDHLVENPREELIQDLRSTRQQGMGVSTLRYPPPVRGIVGQHISLDHCYGPEEISQHPCGKQPTHARAENDRMLSELRHSHP